MHVYMNHSMITIIQTMQTNSYMLSTDSQEDMIVCKFNRLQMYTFRSNINWSRCITVVVNRSSIMICTTISSIDSQRLVTNQQKYTQLFV